MKTIICFLLAFQAPKVAGHRPFGSAGPLEAFKIAKPLQQYGDQFKTAAKLYNLPINMLQAIALAESAGKASAINRRTHDYGLMQINRRNFAHLNLDDKSALQADKNLHAACILLTGLRRKFSNENNWVARYNVGWRASAGRSKAAKRYMGALAAQGWGPVEGGTHYLRLGELK